MTDIGSTERSTQNRVVKLFREQLDYRYLGDRSDRTDNACVDRPELTAFLTSQGASPGDIDQVLARLDREISFPGRGLYENNRAVYALMRYPVKVKLEAGEQKRDIHLIDWERPENNRFGIAEEVTLTGRNTRRPDLVLYVNGLAVAVIELKNSRVLVSEAIGQLQSCQQNDFHPDFFNTVQFVFAGSDAQGLRYGTIGTPTKFYLEWKEPAAVDAPKHRLDRHLAQMCDKARLIELMRDFVLFDGGIKKVPRVHQYVGVKAAQNHVRRREGGVIWHTQGSGKSIVMVLLARWILETLPQARVVIVTDREELDGQIEGVFGDAGEEIARATSGRDLLHQLTLPTPRLLCSLVHKFGKHDADDFDAMIAELQRNPVAVTGELFVFVDECHRTQSGRLHRTMKALLPNAMFIGFTGTPLLKADKETSLEVFGRYIHTYKFGEAVEDEVVLDLVYEARDIDQELTNQVKVDAWFDAKTRGLNDWQRDELKKKWGTLQKVLSSRSRVEQIVQDVVADFATRPRLSSERGNAILVTSSILEACKFHRAFAMTELRERCAIITSYNPHAGDISKEETGANTDSDRQLVYRTYKELVDGVMADPGKTKAQTYEARAKQMFKKEPARMRLLIVVDKLLTGFDAPGCSYLYIDKIMRDHGLFQAICRTNRLDGADKTAGHIVDYKNLFESVEHSIAVYTTELDVDSGGGDDGESPEIMMQRRLERGRQQLDDALEVAELTVQPVPPPQTEIDYIRHFCGDPENATDLKEHEPRRAGFYKAIATLVRAYAGIADDMENAGYSATRAVEVKTRIQHFEKARQTIRLAANEVLDLKPYEADMRYLIDTYIRADDSRMVSTFGDRPLLEVIVKSGIADGIVQAMGEKASKAAVAETIENNVRSTISEKNLTDPDYFARMSDLLQEIIYQRRTDAIDYAAYLQRIEALVANVQRGFADDTPAELNTAGKRALASNLNGNTELACRIDNMVREVRPDAWRGNPTKEKQIKRDALMPLLDGDLAEVERVFAILYEQREY